MVDGANLPDTDRNGRSTMGRILKWTAALGVVLIVVGAVLWQRCGLRGCPDVELLRGYMPDEASVLVDRDGNEVAKLYLTRRVIVSLDSIPEYVVNAFIAIEDKRFWQHRGVDWRRVAGAALANARAGRFEEGSSTITMQLARNVFPEQLPATEQTMSRKLGEARVARAIEGKYEKREIMELYLNQIYFGNGAYGIEAAAEEYFGKSASRLGLAEAALLAAALRAPSRLNPRANEAAAIRRRDLVLRRMAEQGLITEEERATAAADEPALREGRANADQFAPYFIEEVRRQLEDELGSAIYTQGYTIHTTLDAGTQRVVEEELAQTLRAIESGRYGVFASRSYASALADTTQDRSTGTPYLQGAMVVMDARTGEVLALVGGRDHHDSQFNRATQARRQPGSAFKPFVYVAALGAGYPASYRLLDQPLRYDLGNGQVWEPENYDGTFRGVVTMRQALTHSRNVPTVRLANEVGIGRVVSTAERFGLGRLPSNPSVVLGTAEVTPLQLTAAYSTFATLGQRAEPRFVTRVVDRQGHVVWSTQARTRNVIDPAVAFIATTMLQDVVDRGTGTGVRAAGYRGVAGGKTGTTQDAADVWFIGFTPELVGTVWIGFDKRQRILRGATGGEIAAPVWGDVMRRIGAGGVAWAAPAGVERRMVDVAGMDVADGCVPDGEMHAEYYLRGSAPRRAMSRRPLGETDCYPTNHVAYGDTFGAPAEERHDTQATDSADEWWDRLRERVRSDSDRARAREQDRSLPVEPEPMDTEPIRRAPEPDRTGPTPGRREPLGTPVEAGEPPRPPPPDGAYR